MCQFCLPLVMKRRFPTEGFQSIACYFNSLYETSGTILPTKMCLWTNLNIIIGLAVFQTDIEVFTVCDQDSEIYNALVCYLFLYGQN